MAFDGRLQPLGSEASTPRQGSRLAEPSFTRLLEAAGDEDEDSSRWTTTEPLDEPEPSWLTTAADALESPELERKVAAEAEAEAVEKQAEEAEKTPIEGEAVAAETAASIYEANVEVVKPTPITVSDEPFWLTAAADVLASPELERKAEAAAAATAEKETGAVEKAAAEVEAETAPIEREVAASAAVAETAGSTIEADVDAFRSSKIGFKEVVEYHVQARGGAKQRGAPVTSWHRYSDFRDLNDSVAGDLGIPATFPVSKGIIFTASQKEARMRELQAFLRSCVAASQTRNEREGGVPRDLLSFLFTSDTSGAAKVAEVETVAA